jgi:hypothetical protein
MENSVMTPHPKLIVKFWPPSVTAEGDKAINAIRRPLAFAVYARPIVAIILGLSAIWAGHEILPSAFRSFKFW